MAVSWCDDDLVQVENIISEESLHIYEQNMICANKQNNARSATEQWADLAKVFKVMHSLQGKVTVSDVSTDLHLMKRK